ncbi:uncharacterized protein BDR25DRAFT_362479 [Lindgomyces ingoldianus]|uniref:Uncharacterized protein n=1 Tax=Lindgomyces ingoldianus TaxID=673940 RepID=A0ACB6QB43_9PLEO|nr:uncharacterized protein BDR25DRAFT_362479 [Lindgomyces ingoldianus]KAF2463808.1 hypothetical protein BDR25DRAFT_362479 [Lindgomyces ingoldianus]
MCGPTFSRPPAFTHHRNRVFDSSSLVLALHSRRLKYEMYAKTTRARPSGCALAACDWLPEFCLIMYHHVSMNYRGRHYLRLREFAADEFTVQEQTFHPSASPVHRSFIMKSVTIPTSPPHASIDLETHPRVSLKRLHLVHDCCVSGTNSHHHLQENLLKTRVTMAETPQYFLLANSSLHGMQLKILKILDFLADVDCSTATTFHSFLFSYEPITSISPFLFYPGGPLSLIRIIHAVQFSDGCLILDQSHANLPPHSVLTTQSPCQHNFSQIPRVNIGSIRLSTDCLLSKQTTHRHYNPEPHSPHMAFQHLNFNLDLIHKHQTFIPPPSVATQKINEKLNPRPMTLSLSPLLFHFDDCSANLCTEPSYLISCDTEIRSAISYE